MLEIQGDNLDTRSLIHQQLGSFQFSTSWSRIRCLALKTFSRCSCATLALSRRRMSDAVGTESAEGVENLAAPRPGLEVPTIQLLRALSPSHAPVEKAKMSLS